MAAIDTSSIPPFDGISNGGERKSLTGLLLAGNCFTLRTSKADIPAHSGTGGVTFRDLKRGLELCGIDCMGLFPLTVSRLMELSMTSEGSGLTTQHWDPLSTRALDEGLAESMPICMSVGRCNEKQNVQRALPR